MPRAAKVVLITGASSGIGRATALRLQREGHRVIATARKPDALADLTRAGCQTLQLDVTDEASMQRAVDEIMTREGRIDVLINNAGYSQSGALETLSLDAVRRQFETNVFGLLRLTQLVLPHLRKARRGRVVNISSMGGKLTFPGFGAYHASKYAVEALSDALRFESKGFGIDVVVIEPGLIKSGFADAAVSHMQTAGRTDPYAAFDAAIARATKEGYEKGPLARLAGTPDDVAKVISTALMATRPRTRYTVTPSAKLLLAQRRWSTDRMWDWMIGKSLSLPKLGA